MSDESYYDSVTPAPPTPTKPYKALVAFAVAFVGALTATLQGRTDWGNTSFIDWLIIVATAVITAGGVYATTNPATSPVDNRG